MGEDPRLELVERFFRGTGATYDLVVNAATFGIDRRWKRRLVGLIPAHATRILDLACGTGISTAAIARRFPQAGIVGVESGPGRVSLLLGDKTIEIEGRVMN